jgi:hypothetical protein
MKNAEGEDQGDDVSAVAKATFADSVELPRWVLATGILLIGIMLLLGALSDASGKAADAGRCSVLYIAVVIAAAAVLVYSGRHSPEKDHRQSPPRPQRQ